MVQRRGPYLKWVGAVAFFSALIHAGWIANFLFGWIGIERRPRHVSRTSHQHVSVAAPDEGAFRVDKGETCGSHLGFGGTARRCTLAQSSRQRREDLRHWIKELFGDDTAAGNERTVVRRQRTG